MSDHFHECRECGATIDAGCESDARCYWRGSDQDCTAPHWRDREASDCPAGEDLDGPSAEQERAWDEQYDGTSLAGA